MIDKRGIFSDINYEEAIGKSLYGTAQIAEQIQPNSIDLSISNKIYRVQSSFFPINSTVADKINELAMYEMSLNDSIVLERNNIYIIELNESLKLPLDVRGKCNPKSSTGRLDIFTRVITDYCKAFDSVDYGYSGKLYLEIMPRSFSIRVHKNQPFCQLRLSKGQSKLSDADLLDYYKENPLLFNEDEELIPASKKVINNGINMSLGLNSNDGVVGYKAKKNSQVIDLNKLKHYKISDFWEVITPSHKIILEPEEFYIFRSKERIKIPADICGDMNAYDVSLGELRTHYAGFFDSGFGLNNGSHIVMEVRSHDIPFLVEDGQRMFSVQFERNAAAPARLYGAERKSNYQNQRLKLAKQFKML
jgi:dCTP deaminase